MTKITLGLLFSLMCTSLSIAQNNEIETLIRQLDQQNAQVVVKADTVLLMKLLAPEFTINRTTGTIESGREKTLALMRKGMVTYDSFSVVTEMVVVKSSILAVSIGSEVVISGGTREKKGEIIRRRFTHVWSRESGEGQLLARHANNVCAN